MSFLTTFNLAKDADLRNRVYGSLVKAAGDILNEDAETASHAERVKLALSIIADPGEGSVPAEFTRLAASNVTVQASAPNYVDNDLDFVVASFLTAVAVAKYG